MGDQIELVLEGVVHVLQADREWLAQIVPAINNEEFRNGIGIDLPDEIISRFAQQFSYSEVARAPSPKKASVEDLRERTEQKRFRKNEKTDYNQKTCAICLGEFRSNQKLLRLKGCRHEFHRDCVSTWLKRERAACPICREKL